MDGICVTREQLDLGVEPWEGVLGGYRELSSIFMWRVAESTGMDMIVPGQCGVRGS